MTNDVSSVKRLDVPTPIPHPFTEFADSWLDFVRANNGKPVVLKDQTLMGVQSLGARLSGWKIEGEVHPPVGTSSWVPIEWLVDIDAKKVQSCDCPMNILLSQGCQNSAHE